MCEAHIKDYDKYRIKKIPIYLEVVLNRFK